MKKQRGYTESFKWKVVQEVLEGKYTKEEAKRVYNIRSNCAVLYRMRKFSGQDNYREPITSEIMGRENTRSEQAVRIKKLEEELLKEKQKTKLFKKIVEVAEEEFGIDIVKKYGARQYEDLKKKGKQG